MVREDGADSSSMSATLSLVGEGPAFQEVRWGANAWVVPIPRDRSFWDVVDEDPASFNTAAELSFDSRASLKARVPETSDGQFAVLFVIEVDEATYTSSLSFDADRLGPFERDGATMLASRLIRQPDISGTIGFGAYDSNPHVLPDPERQHFALDNDRRIVNLITPTSHARPKHVWVFAMIGRLNGFLAKPVNKGALVHEQELNPNVNIPKLTALTHSPLAMFPAGSDVTLYFVFLDTNQEYWHRKIEFLKVGGQGPATDVTISSGGSPAKYSVKPVY